eukprot:7356005-Prymnesium_polylepis.1
MGGRPTWPVRPAIMIDDAIGTPHGNASCAASASRAPERACEGRGLSRGGERRARGRARAFTARGR